MPPLLLLLILDVTFGKTEPALPAQRTGPLMPTMFVNPSQMHAKLMKVFNAQAVLPVIPSTMEFVKELLQFPFLTQDVAIGIGQTKSVTHVPHSGSSTQTESVPQLTSCAKPTTTQTVTA